MLQLEMNNAVNIVSFRRRSPLNLGVDNKEARTSCLVFLAYRTRGVDVLLALVAALTMRETPMHERGVLTWPIITWIPNLHICACRSLARSSLMQ